MTQKRIQFSTTPPELSDLFPDVASAVGQCSYVRRVTIGPNGKHAASLTWVTSFGLVNNVKWSRFSSPTNEWWTPACARCGLGAYMTASMRCSSCARGPDMKNFWAITDTDVKLVSTGLEQQALNLGLDVLAASILVGEIEMVSSVLSPMCRKIEAQIARELRIQAGP